jgi:hypothetical protein
MEIERYRNSMVYVHLDYFMCIIVDVYYIRSYKQLIIINKGYINHIPVIII